MSRGPSPSAQAMRIAQISPLCESIPPRRYGGTERVVHYLTEELVRRGHAVVLFASGDSRTSAELFPCVPEALRLAGYNGDPTVPELIQLDQLMDQLNRFDVLHFHTGASHYPLVRQLPVPHLNTLHGPLTAPDRAQLYRQFHQLPLVSISEAQRQPLPEAHWLATVHHGLPLDLYQPVGTPDNYLAFVGRISPEKRLDRAIAIAGQLGMPLKVAAKIDSSDRCTLVRLSSPVQEVDEACLQLHRGELDTGVLVKRRTSGVDVVIHKWML